MAVVVNDGNVGEVSLKGARYWLTGDLGDDFGDGKTPWLVITFDPQVTQAQRDGLVKVLRWAGNDGGKAVGDSSIAIRWKAV